METFYINKPQDLVEVLGKSIEENKTSGNLFIIGNSLDCSEIANFVPLGSGTNYSFNGELDGNGYTIKNLSINLRQAYDLGLFAKIGADGKVKNLQLDAINIVQISGVIGGTTTTRAGAIAAVCQGEISGCSARGTIIVKADTSICQVGGLCGSLPYIASKINNSCSDVSISFQSVNSSSAESTGSESEKSYFAGGIAGSASGSIVSCHSRSEISPPPEKITGYIAGGICGEADSGAKITACYNIGYLHSRAAEGDELGGVTGKAASGAEFIKCFYLKGYLLSKNFIKTVGAGDKIGNAKKWSELTAPGFAAALCGDYADTQPDDYLYTPSLVLFKEKEMGGDNYLKALCTPVAVSFTQSVYPDTTFPVKIDCELSDCFLKEASLTAVKPDKSSVTSSPPVSGLSFSQNLGNNNYISYDFILTLKDRYGRIVAVSDVDIDMNC